MTNTKLSKFEIDELRRRISITIRDCSLTKEQRNKFREIESILRELEATVGPMEQNCANCAHPWRKEAREVYCYAKDDEYYEHALVIAEPERHVCSNYEPQGKRYQYCGYEWGCSLKKDGKCTHPGACRCQVAKPKKTTDKENKQ